LHRVKYYDVMICDYSPALQRPHGDELQYACILKWSLQPLSSQMAYVVAYIIYVSTVMRI
jgi:hypothetical protein